MIKQEAAAAELVSGLPTVPRDWRRFQGSKVPWMCGCDKSPKTWPEARKGSVEFFFFSIIIIIILTTTPSPTPADLSAASWATLGGGGRAPPSRCKVIRPVGESCRALQSGSLCLTCFHQLVMTLAVTSQPTRSNGRGGGVELGDWRFKGKYIQRGDEYGYVTLI